MANDKNGGAKAAPQLTPKRDPAPPTADANAWSPTQLYNVPHDYKVQVSRGIIKDVKAGVHPLPQDVAENPYTQENGVTPFVAKPAADEKPAAEPTKPAADKKE
jgi:hypothetical protein